MKLAQNYLNLFVSRCLTFKFGFNRYFDFQSSARFLFSAGESAEQAYSGSDECDNAYHCQPKLSSCRRVGAVVDEGPETFRKLFYALKSKSKLLLKLIFKNC